MNHPMITDGRGLIINSDICSEMLLPTGKTLEDIKQFYGVEYDCGYFLSLCHHVASVHEWKLALQLRQEADG